MELPFDSVTEMLSFQKGATLLNQLLTAILWLNDLKITPNSHGPGLLHVVDAGALDGARQTQRGEFREATLLIQHVSCRDVTVDYVLKIIQYRVKYKEKRVVKNHPHYECAYNLFMKKVECMADAENDGAPLLVRHLLVVIAHVLVQGDS